MRRNVSAVITQTSGPLARPSCFIVAQIVGAPRVAVSSAPRNPQMHAGARKLKLSGPRRLSEALREDPHVALAYSGLADCYGVGWWAKPNIPVAERYARKALALEPTDN